MNKTINDYPIILNAVHIAENLMISKPSAYELMEQNSFPLIRIGRNKRIMRDIFFEWLSKQ